MELTQWVTEIAPRFTLSGEDIRIFLSPNEFYLELLSKISRAKHRITLAALYLGTGELEIEIVRALDNRLAEAENLELLILLDHQRGTRGDPSSVTLLNPLKAKYGSRVRIGLYLSPVFRAITTKLPARWNEIIAVQHMKAYLFDDDIIISGCNLSNIYFTNRQDRYFLISNQSSLTNFVHSLINIIYCHSLQSNMLYDLPKTIISSNASQLGQKIKELIKDTIRRSQSTQDEKPTDDTIIYPTVQMWPHGITQDEEITQTLFLKTKEFDSIYLSSGYFNLPKAYTNLFVRTPATYRVLAASRETNGFFKGLGLSANVPDMYMHQSNRFLKIIHPVYPRIRYYEYHKPDWTFHAKGVWYYNKGETLPSLTLVGSPNFGYRSVRRDTELQFMIETKNRGLRTNLDTECKYLFSKAHAIEVTYDQIRHRKVKRLIQIVAKLFRNSI